MSRRTAADAAGDRRAASRGAGLARLAAPCAVTEVDVAAPIGALDPRPARRAASPHQAGGRLGDELDDARAVPKQALVLVRAGTDPLGLVVVPLLDGRASPDVVVDTVLGDLGAEIARRRRAAGWSVAPPADATTGVPPSLRPPLVPLPAGPDVGADASFTVAVPTRDRPEQLAGCLAALTAPGVLAADTDVLVVDNAPRTDATRAVVERVGATDARVRYLRIPLGGLDRARNAALREARGRRLAFVDDDVRVGPGWLAALGRGFGRATDVVAVTGLVLPARLDSEAEVAFESAVGWARKGRFEPCLVDLATHRPESPLFPFDVGTLGSGNNLAIEVEALRRIGGFDDALDAGSPARTGGDLDVLLRLLLAGGAVAREPAAVAWHAHRVDEVALRRQLFGYGAGFSAFLTKHLLDPSTARQMLARLPAAAGRAGRLVVGGSTEAAAGLPARLAVVHAAGLVAGPVLYARSRRWAAVGNRRHESSSPADATSRRRPVGRR